MVASMALIELIYIITTIIDLGLTFLTGFWIGFGYIHSILLLFLLYMAVVRIPLVLNWSSNLYASIFRRFVFFQIYSIFSYAICYSNSVAMKNKFQSFWDALYFSATTWSTLGYGDISPIGNIRLLTSIEALTGLLTLPILVSVIWLYCDQRLLRKPREAKEMGNLKLELDNALGIWVEVESEKTIKEQARRDKIKLKPCECDKSSPYIQKYYDVIGKLTPFSKFVVVCRSCGSISKPAMNAYLAAWLWSFKKHKH